MIWKKEKKPELPTETLDQEEYYIANPSELTNLNDVNIKFEGTLSEKPVIEYYATGWPWSISSRIIEEDHGHRTILKVDSINVYCRGLIYLKKDERITVWGKLIEGDVQAKKIESADIIYQS